VLNKLLFIFLLTVIYNYENIYAQSSLKGGDTDTSINKINEKGQKTGKWIKKYNNGQIRYEGYFYNDRPYGNFKYYYDNGKLKSEVQYISTDDTTKLCYAKFYSEYGKILAEGYYKSEKKDSIWRYYNEDGILIIEERYKDFVKHGKSYVFFSNGNISQETNWNKGIQDGAMKEYYPNGTISYYCNYINGKIEGKAYGYYDTGQKRVEGKYINSMKDSTWIYYNENGTIKRTVVYKKGDVVKVDGEIEKWPDLNKRIEDDDIKRWEYDLYNKGGY